MSLRYYDITAFSTTSQNCLKCIQHIPMSCAPSVNNSEIFRRCYSVSDSISRF